MNAKFTPGPWTFRPDDMLIIRKKRSLVDTLHIAKVCHQYPETDGNTRLIAAAPDMYEALKALRKWVDVYSGGKVEMLKRNADAAIAKAEGQL